MFNHCSGGGGHDWCMIMDKCRANIHIDKEVEEKKLSLLW
jgi:hypothetical protein